jgi:hypothetical protein
MAIRRLRNIAFDVTQKSRHPSTHRGGAFFLTRSAKLLNAGLSKGVEGAATGA